MCFAYQDHTHNSIGHKLYQDGGVAFKAELPTQQNQDGLGRPVMPGTVLIEDKRQDQHGRERHQPSRENGVFEPTDRERSV
jgi:hypothetical protein